MFVHHPCKFLTRVYSNLVIQGWNHWVDISPILTCAVLPEQVPSLSHCSTLWIWRYTSWPTQSGFQVTWLAEAYNLLGAVVVLQRVHTDSLDWLCVILTSSDKRKWAKQWQTSIICNSVLLGPTERHKLKRWCVLTEQ